MFCFHYFYFQSFLATAKKPGLGLLFTILAGVTNVVGDALLVGVLSNGDPIKAIQGAAISTAAGLFVGGVIPLIYFVCKNKSLLRLGKSSLERIAHGTGFSRIITLVKPCLKGSVERIVFGDGKSCFCMHPGLAAHLVDREAHTEAILRIVFK